MTAREQGLTAKLYSAVDVWGKAEEMCRRTAYERHWHRIIYNKWYLLRMRRELKRRFKDRHMAAYLLIRCQATVDYANGPNTCHYPLTPDGLCPNESRHKYK